MTSRLAFSLLGGFAIHDEHQPIAVPPGSRLQSLLAYLAIHADQAQTRPHLSCVFWPDASEPRARNNLRQLLHQLRHAAPAIEPFIAIDASSVAWRPEIEITLDLFEFRRALQRADDADRAADPIGRRTALERAISFYKGDLFPGCYDNWLVPERDHLRELWLRALASLVDLLEDQHEFDAAIDHAQRLARFDPLDESTARTLMRLFAARNDRARALRVYHACASALSRELGISPSRETRAAYERLIRTASFGTDPGEPYPIRKAPRLLAGRQLIGRRSEWGLLQTAWRGATGGRPQVALISGEAGLGKTRLAEEFATWIRARSGGIASARCYPAEGRLALAPATDLLRSEAIQPNLARLDPIWLTEITRLLPELAAAYPSLSHPEPISEYGQRQRFFEALARAMLGGPHPLLIIIDDLQWCDRETIEWLHFLLRYDSRARLMLIGTIRSDEISPPHPLSTLLDHLGSVVDIREFPLPPLDLAETARLAAEVAGRELNPESADQLFRETEGNPLYIVEMVRAEMERPAGRLGQEDCAAIPSSEENWRLPPRVHAVIAARLAQISEPALEILGLAASIGREFRLDVLTQAARRDEDTVIGALDELWHKRIIREQGINAYDFTHDKLREIAYEQISAPHRQRFHREIARALEALHPDDLGPVSGQIAANYERAGLAGQAIPFYQRAATTAQRVYSYREAIDLLCRARALLDRLPNGVTRDRVELDLLLALASLYRVTKGWAAREVEEVLSRALALCDTLDDDHQRIQVYYGRESLTVVQGKLAAVQDLSSTLSAMHERTFGRAPPRLAGVMRIGARLHLGYFREAIEQFEEITAVPDQSQLQRLEESQGANYYVLARAWQSHALWCRGFPALAFERCQAVTHLARDLQQPFSQALAASYLALLQQWAAEPIVARAAAEDALALADAAAAPYYRAWATILATYAQIVAQPRLDQVERLRAAIEEFRETGARLRLPYYRSLLAQVQARSGRITEGLITIDEALADARARGESWWNADLYRLRAALLHRLGVDPAVVDEELCRAIEIARYQGALSLELRALITLARARRGRSSFDQARTQLATLYAQFTDGFETPDLRTAHDLLEQGAGS